jgi:hypothetical protein
VPVVDGSACEVALYLEVSGRTYENGHLDVTPFSATLPIPSRRFAYQRIATNRQSGLLPDRGNTPEIMRHGKHNVAPDTSLAQKLEIDSSPGGGSEFCPALFHDLRIQAGNGHTALWSIRGDFLI